MIRSFKSKSLKRLHMQSDARGIRFDVLPRTQRILVLLDVAAGPNALNLPGLSLHQLKGASLGTWAVSVNANWRITFRFHDGHAEDVDLLDYH